MSDAPNSISIIIPALNEAQTIGPLVAAVKKMSFVKEVVVIDDGSSDATSSIAKDNGAVVIRHLSPKGNGAAVKTGLKAATSEWVIIVDADGQHAAADLEKLAAFSADVDLVVGARPFRWLRFRDFGNLFLSKLASIICGVKIPDLTSGLRRIHRAKALLFRDLYPQGFSFPSTSTIMFVTSYMNVEFLPIENKPRPAHASKSKLHPIRDGIKFMTIIYRIILLSYPLRFFVPIGLLSLLFGFIWVARTMLMSGQISAAGVLFLLGGLTLLLFGSIADQLSHLRRAVSRLE